MAGAGFYSLLPNSALKYLKRILAIRGLMSADGHKENGRTVD
jgi:hypothetical protein